MYASRVDILRAYDDISIALNVLETVYFQFAD